MWCGSGWTHGESAAELISGAVAEHEVDDEGVDPVEAADERHHDDDEHENDEREGDELFAGRGDDLAQLGEHLADEEAEAPEGTALLGALLASIGDDVLR